MATLGEQARTVQEDTERQHKRRFRIVIDERTNGHKIEHHNGDWHELEAGMMSEKQIRFALEQLLEKGFSNRTP